MGGSDDYDTNVGQHLFGLWVRVDQMTNGQLRRQLLLHTTIKNTWKAGVEKGNIEADNVQTVLYGFAMICRNGSRKNQDEQNHIFSGT